MKIKDTLENIAKDIKNLSMDNNTFEIYEKILKEMESNGIKKANDKLQKLMAAKEKHLSGCWISVMNNILEAMKKRNC